LLVDFFLSKMGLRFNHKWTQRFQAALRYQPLDSARVSSGSSLSPLPHEVPINAEWDEAFLRVESYLRAHQIESRVLLNRLTSEIIVAARALATEHPGEPPVTLAMQVAHARIGEWMVQALGGGDWADRRLRARGRLATLMAEIPHQCPERFLTPDELPPEIQERMRSAQLAAGPEMRLTSMTATPLEFPSAGVGEKWSTFNRSAFSRAAASWLIIAGGVGVIWFMTR
jgi:hypothetical protein